MKLKTFTHEGVSYAVLDDKGLPVYAHDDGKESGFDAPAAASTITRLNGEAMGHRQAKEKAERDLKAFEGISDPAAALDALNKIKNLDDKKLIDAGEVERVKAEVAKGYEGKLVEADGRYKDLESRFHGTQIAHAFASSKFIGEKVAIPADMLQATFGRHFGVDDQGRVIAKDHAGNPIGSKVSFGDPASFDEAIEQIVNGYQHKDTILKGQIGSGGGAGQGGGGAGGKRTISRAEFDKMDPASKAAASKDARDGKAVIAD